ncbi:MAG: zinc ribbon domain-containing protein [Endomicrobium sp.]|nr:zinc ribbon domain-containing protein [Endomicrobium sp.]
MPLFEFICGKCGKEFETLVLSGDESTECPFCKSGEVTKLFSSFSSVSPASTCANADICRPKSRHKCSGGCCNH